MEEVKIILRTAPRTKKNSQQIFFNKATGKRMIVPSKQYKEYEQACLWHIGTGAFEDCTSLQNVTILSDAVKIEGHAFWNCARLVGRGGFIIQKGTLCSCTAEKKNVRIPDGVTHIGWDALRGCGDYQTLSMPKALLGEASRETLRGTNAGLILREEGHTSFMAYSQYSCGYGGNDGEDNLDGFVKRSKWQEYDQELINNGPIFKYRVPTRLLGMLGRLQDPVQLSGSAKEVFLEYLVKNVKKLVALAEETYCPDMITAAALCGVINDTNVPPYYGYLQRLP